MTDPAVIRVLKDMLKEMTLMRKAIQRMAPPPRELDIPDLETYCEMLEEGEDEQAKPIRHPKPMPSPLVSLPNGNIHSNLFLLHQQRMMFQFSFLVRTL